MRPGPLRTDWFRCRVEPASQRRRHGRRRQRHCRPTARRLRDGSADVDCRHGCIRRLARELAVVGDPLCSLHSRHLERRTRIRHRFLCERGERDRGVWLGGGAVRAAAVDSLTLLALARADPRDLARRFRPNGYQPHRRPDARLRPRPRVDPGVQATYLTFHPTAALLYIA